jgi:hypothetical protein
MADRKILISGLADEPLHAIAALLNDLIDAHTALCAKLDADIAAGGATEVDYESTVGVTDKIKDALTGSEV